MRELYQGIGFGLICGNAAMIVVGIASRDWPLAGIAFVGAIAACYFVDSIDPA